MIKLKEFLLNSYIKIGTYALVTYNNKTHAIWFTRYNLGDGDWFLESPCQLYKICEIEGDVDEFSKNYVGSLLDEEEDSESYIEQFIKPMIIDNILYEIENFQCSPYLPEYVDEIKLISNKECLEFMLKH